MPAPNNAYTQWPAKRNNKLIMNILIDIAILKSSANNTATAHMLDRSHHIMIKNYE